MTKVTDRPTWIAGWLWGILSAVVALVVLLIAYIWNDHIDDQKHRDKLQDLRINELEDFHD